MLSKLIHRPLTTVYTCKRVGDDREKKTHTQWMCALYIYGQNWEHRYQAIGCTALCVDVLTLMHHRPLLCSSSPRINKYSRFPFVFLFFLCCSFMSLIIFCMAWGGASAPAIARRYIDIVEWPQPSSRAMQKTNPTKRTALLYGFSPPGQNAINIRECIKTWT